MTKPFIMWACTEKLSLDSEIIGKLGSVQDVLEHETAAQFPSALEWLFSPDEMRAEMRLAITRGGLRSGIGYSEVASTVALLATTFGSNINDLSTKVQEALRAIGLPEPLVRWEPLDDDLMVVPSSDCISTSPYFPPLCAGYTRALGPEFGGLMRLDALAVGLTAQCSAMNGNSAYGNYLATRESDRRWDETWNRVTRFVGGWELTESDHLTLQSPASGVRVTIDRTNATWSIELHS